MKKKICIIVGFGSGNAFALAKASGREGYDLALVSRNPDRHSALIGDLQQTGYG